MYPAQNCTNPNQTQSGSTFLFGPSNPENENILFNALPEVFEALPLPTFFENIIHSAKEGAKHGSLRGITNASAYALERFNQPKSVITTAQLGIYWTGLVLMMLYENMNLPQQRDRNFSNVFIQSVLSAAFFMAINMCLQLITSGIKNIGRKATQNGWITSGKILNKLSDYLPLSIYALNAARQGEIAMTVASISSGIISQFAIEQPSKVIIDTVRPCPMQN